VLLRIRVALLDQLQLDRRHGNAVVDFRHRRIVRLAPLHADADLGPRRQIEYVPAVRLDGQEVQLAGPAAGFNATSSVANSMTPSRSAPRNDPVHVWPRVSPAGWNQSGGGGGLRRPRARVVAVTGFVSQLSRNRLTVLAASKANPVFQ